MDNVAARHGGIEQFPLDPSMKYGVECKYLIRGDEGFIFEFQKPLETGAEVVKFWHSSHRSAWDAEFNRKDEPKFLFSSYSEGYHRFYHLYRLAHLLMPNNFIEVLEVETPDNLPQLFDVLDYPTNEQGEPDFPAFYMRKVSYSNDQFQALSRRNKKIWELEAQGAMLMDAGCRDVERYIEINGKIQTVTSLYDFNDISVDLGLRMMHVYDEFEMRGFEIPHWQANCCLDDNGNAVVFEIIDEVCLPNLLDYMGLLIGQDRESAYTHLRKAVDYTTEAVRKARTDEMYMGDREKTGFNSKTGENIPIERLENLVEAFLEEE